ncbi:1-deoxy-D-xylulose-5-phosphate reductoisomerase [Salsipaludibacter albus]|uniref:1-deoxy-D-xylulose-5-phosphate reductoisomerase n=1 Tax=Salsipaludibacter albus TaxID=2849650 RepID=UPI001EE3DA40|nr:1-deoxy-D-xylulose-5-phosphate reductoisomerase [Salsipaludibacter albus]
MTTRLVILGSTGSIGTQALDVVRAHPERFEVVALGTGQDVDGLVAQAEEFGVDRLAVADPDAAASAPGGRAVAGGAAAVEELAAIEADVVLNGIDGAAGLVATMTALEAGTPVALANKESLIVGGDLVVAAADRAGGRATHLLPVDSEHSALAQCLRAGTPREVARLVVTASGGPFRGRRRDDLRDVTAAEALDHPTWSMGPLITVNSSTLANKGLELVEAHLLFDLPMERIEPVVHPQSIVHSMVEFVDGSTIAQLSPPDMRLPIQLALGWPERLDRAFVAMDWTSATSLDFEPVDHDAFPALGLVVEAGRLGGTHPAVANAANEVAVEAFLDDRLAWLDIATAIADALEAHAGGHTPAPRDVDDVLDADRWARAHTRRAIAAR